MVVVQGSFSFHPRPEPKKFEPSKKLSGNFKIRNSTKYILFASTWHIDIQPLSMQHKSLFNVLEWCQIFWIINVPINLSFTVKSGAYTHFWIVQVSASCLDWSIFCFWYFAIKENTYYGWNLIWVFLLCCQPGKNFDLGINGQENPFQRKSETPNKLPIWHIFCFSLKIIC